MIVIIYTFILLNSIASENSENVENLSKVTSKNRTKDHLHVLVSKIHEYHKYMDKIKIEGRSDIGTIPKVQLVRNIVIGVTVGVTLILFLTVILLRSKIKQCFNSFIHENRTNRDFTVNTCNPSRGVDNICFTPRAIISISRNNFTENEQGEEIYLNGYSDQSS